MLQDAQSYEEERRAFAILKLALQGEQDIVEGRSVSYAEHRKHMNALLARLRK